jgi:hypothetical protein
MLTAEMEMEIKSSGGVILKILEVLYYLCPFLVGSSFLVGSYTSQSRGRLNRAHCRYISLWLMLGVVLSYVGSF